MFTLQATVEFTDWLKTLGDRRARLLITSRLDRLSVGHWGDCAPVGDGVMELRLHFGPGYRIYIKRRREELIILLVGGSKRTQRRDIDRAMSLARELEIDE
jgi:putative addiction module killer protein